MKDFKMKGKGSKGSERGQKEVKGKERGQKEVKKKERGLHAPSRSHNRATSHYSSCKILPSFSQVECQ